LVHANKHPWTKCGKLLAKFIITKKEIPEIYAKKDKDKDKESEKGRPLQ
jgi:hypothetical protein